MKSKLAVYMILGAIISAFALYFSFKNVPFDALLRYMNSINYFWAAMGAGVAVISIVLRVIRWRIIIGALNPVTFWEAFHPLAIGFMINNVFPGRTGEIARPGILTFRSRISFSSGLATVAAERLMDLFFLVMLFLGLSYTMELSPASGLSFSGYHISGEIIVSVFKGLISACFLLFTGIIVLSFETSRKWCVDLIFKIPALFFWASRSFRKKFTRKICTPLAGFCEKLASGFSLVRQPKRIYICAVATVAIWLVQAWSFYLVALGCPGLSLSFWEITAVMILICFSITLPSVPGYWGLWEAGGIFALSLFGIAREEAIGYTLVNHAVQILPVTIIGLVSVWATSLNFSRISKLPARMAVEKV